MKKVQGMCWKHIHCLILHVKAEPLLPCVQPFHTRWRGKKKKKDIFAHILLPLMENGAGYNESQQWSLMKQQILISFQFRRRRALYYQAGLCFFW